MEHWPSDQHYERGRTPERTIRSASPLVCNPALITVGRLQHVPVIQQPFGPVSMLSEQALNALNDGSRTSYTSKNDFSIFLGQNTASVQWYHCTYYACGRRFDTVQGLEGHEHYCHGAPHNPSGTPGNSRSASPASASSMLGERLEWAQSERDRSADMASAALLARKSQSGPHRCSRINPATGKPCNTIFSRPYDLTRHEDQFHDNRKKKISCSYCREEKTFSRSDALTRHMRQAHPEVESFGKRGRRADDRPDVVQSKTPPKPDANTEPSLCTNHHAREPLKFEWTSPPGTVSTELTIKGFTLLSSPTHSAYHAGGPCDDSQAMDEGFMDQGVLNSDMLSDAMHVEYPPDAQFLLVEEMDLSLACTDRGDRPSVASPGGLHRPFADATERLQLAMEDHRDQAGDSLELTLPPLLQIDAACSQRSPFNQCLATQSTTADVIVAPPKPDPDPAIAVQPAKFQCSVCDKTFSRRTILENHQRAHTGEKPFICDIAGCVKAFRQKNERRRHQTANHSDKRYVCGGGDWGCGKRFARKDGLLEHHQKTERGKRCWDERSLEEHHL